MSNYLAQSFSSSQPCKQSTAREIYLFDTCHETIMNCQAFLIYFREKGLEDAIIAAKDVAEEIDIEPIFPIKRSRRKKTVFL